MFTKSALKIYKIKIGNSNVVRIFKGGLEVRTYSFVKFGILFKKNMKMGIKKLVKGEKKYSHFYEPNS